MTSGAAAMAIFAGVLIVAALLLLLYVIEDAWVERGYRGGDKPVSEYRRPPAGPAPGSRKETS